jgi:hypothetical protein
MGVHCIAHRANLVVQSLKDLPQFLGLKFSWWTCMVISTTLQKGTWSFRNQLKPWIQKGTKKF